MQEPLLPSPAIPASNQGLAALDKIKTLDATPKRSYRCKTWSKHLPCTSGCRLAKSTALPTPDAPLRSPSEKEPTVLYLAYGSNLCAETFQGKRGIRPLSAVNVVVPSLTMTFDLPGIPYAEPCFANSALRTKSPKEQWPHGLVGVVYEVTPTDYAHIIATEGGGASYLDITVECFPLAKDAQQVPEIPSTPPFVAHTLFAPANSSLNLPHGNLTAPPSRSKTTTNDRPTRRDPSYAQPSARYLNLITTGAAEHALPADYTRYLHSLRPYTITTTAQRLGQFIFLMIWVPVIAFLFLLANIFGNKDGTGKSPAWLAWIMEKVFVGMWGFYDGGFKDVFGDGERTMEGRGGGEGDGRRIRLGTEKMDVV